MVIFVSFKKHNRIFIAIPETIKNIYEPVILRYIIPYILYSY